MPKKLNLEKDDNGRYQTGGLNERQFQQAFKIIEGKQKKNRRKAKRTLTPAQIRAKKQSDIAKLGEKSKGVPFTVEDLQEFEKSRQKHKKAFGSTTAGITYAQLVAGSREIDIKRANNQVNDGSGISRATLSGVKDNIILVRVKASMKSVHQEHLVKIRLEEHNDYLHEPPGDSYTTAAKMAAQGRLSFDCDCGRHQYWYRYLATVGNYAVAPPKEFSFPKIRNPQMKGVACKHVLKAAVMLQSASWHRIIGRQMEVQASRIAYGDDRKRTHVIKDQEAKEASRNRSTQINPSKVQAQFKKYQRSQKALDQALKKGSKEIEKIRSQARRLRKQNNTIKKQNQQIGEMRDMLKASFNMFADGIKATGGTRQDAISKFAKQMNMSETKLKGVLK